MTTSYKKIVENVRKLISYERHIRISKYDFYENRNDERFLKKA